jgi:CRISPR system Cascade subunit CasB
VTGTERLFAHGELSEEDLSRAEAAMFLAVTLYALHQQSRRDRGMHQTGAELGTAVRRLMSDGDIDEPIRRRFVRVGLAPNVDALAYRLREIISLLRSESIPLDYVALARQLYLAQTAGGMRRVRQTWGRGFHAYRPPDAEVGPDDETVTDKDTR